MNDNFRNHQDDDKIQLRWASKNRSVSEKDVYDDVTWKFEDLVKKLEVRHRQVGPNAKRNTEVNTKMQQRVIKTQHHPAWGKCYTFSIDYDLAHRGVGSLQIWV